MSDSAESRRTGNDKWAKICEVHDFVHFPLLERGAKEIELDNIDIEKGRRTTALEF